EHDRVHGTAVLLGEILQQLELRQLLRETSTADRAVREKRDVAPRALLGDVDRLAEVRVEPVLHRHDRKDLLRLVDLRDRHVAEAEVLELAAALQLRERLDALLELHAGIGRVELIEPDTVDVERAQTRLARLADVRWRAVVGPRAARAAQAAFRRDADPVAIGSLA